MVVDMVTGCRASPPRMTPASVARRANSVYSGVNSREVGAGPVDITGVIGSGVTPPVQEFVDSGVQIGSRDRLLLHCRLFKAFQFSGDVRAERCDRLRGIRGAHALQQRVEVCAIGVVDAMRL